MPTANLITGTPGNDALFGTAGVDEIRGLGGDDTLNGRYGPDLMIGGDGSDTYGVDNPDDVVVEVDTDTGVDHVITSVTYSVEGTHVENVSMVGRHHANVTGNDLDNVIRGNSGNNQLYGMGGNDTLYGGTYDWLYGGDGDDILRTDGRSSRMYGDAGNDTLLGSGDPNRIDGGVGDDHMSGGLGNDSYYVDSTGDKIVEAENGGYDIVFSEISFSLAAALESLTLQGDAIVGNGNAKNNNISGNEQDNVLRGFAGNDYIRGDFGNDTIDGGTGADTMDGGYGFNVYYIDNASDEVMAYRGIDRAYSSVSITGGMAEYVEVIHLTGTDDLDITLSRYNNKVAHTFHGNTGNNVISSIMALDTLLGHDGDDTYNIWNAQNTVIEGAGFGYDTVNTSFSYKLTAHVEVLNLTDIDPVNGFGNGIDNVLNGNRGDNHLAGREGNDTLTGGLGDDTFIFDRAIGAGNVDDITDFNNADDTLSMKSGEFGNLAKGALDAAAFHLGASAGDASDRFIYNAATSELFFDADGAGGAAQQLVANITLFGTATLSADDFWIA